MKETCYNIKDKMINNNLIYISINDSLGHQYLLSYSEVNNLCKLQDWYFEQDLNILNDITKEA